MNRERKSESSDSVRFADFVEAVKARYSLDHAFEKELGTRLIGTGSARMALCPFHDDKRPSLSVNVGSGLYKCHSAGCDAQGDVFTLLMSAYDTDFNGAVAIAAANAGMEVPASFRREAGFDARHRPKKRAAVKPPSDEVGQVPAGLGGHGLVALESESHLPAPGVQAYVWDPRKAPHQRRHLPEMVHVYRDPEGRPLAAILRCLGKPGPGEKKAKYFIPLVLQPASEAVPSGMRIPMDGGDMVWTIGGPGDQARRPIYGIEELPAWAGGEDRKILVVDGEKTVDAARRMIGEDPTWLVLSAMGGGSSVLRADWHPVLESIGRDGRPVSLFVWPDADRLLVRPDGRSVDRQEKYVTGVATSFFQSAADLGIDRSALSCFRVFPPEGVESGWDLADAEAEGWTLADVLSSIDRNAGDFDMSKMKIREDMPSVGVTDELDGHAVDDMAALAGDDTEDLLASIDAAVASAGLGGLTPETVDAVDINDEPDTIIDEGGDGDDGDDVPTCPTDLVSNNPHFRCLGHRDGVDHFVSLESGYIYGLTPTMLKPSYYLKLARKTWWMRHFPGSRNRNGDVISVDWESVMDALISGSYAAGVWDPSREIGQGACIDGGRVVFNTGSLLHVEGVGLVPIREFRGDNCYVMGAPSRTPAFDNPLPENDPDVLKFLDIVQSLNWRPERKSLSVMSLLGWLAIGPISGILSWRPHLWLDGPRSSGKSWIINYLIAPLLGDYCVLVKSNSTESGIRNALHSKAYPLIFDEAEGESRNDRDRVDAIIRMARHSASDGKSVVLQGTSGGGGQRHFSVRSPFLFCSITQQLEAAADKTRFAHAQLNEGRGLAEFSQKIEIPAMDLLTEEFSDRFTARMILRAPDFKATFRMMVKALSALGIERRMADVYGTFAAGSWLLLRDGTPEDDVTAMQFLVDTFNAIAEIEDHGSEVSEDKDHTRLFRLLQSATIRVESGNMGTRMERLGNLFAAASGCGGGDCILSQAEALQALRDIGIRPAISSEDQQSFELIGEGEVADCLVFHRNSVQIGEILANTSYGRSYSQVLSQASNVRYGRVVRFSPVSGVSRTIVVPLENFSIQRENERRDG